MTVAIGPWDVDQTGLSPAAATREANVLTSTWDNRDVDVPKLLGARRFYVDHGDVPDYAPNKPALAYNYGRQGDGRVHVRLRRGLGPEFPNPSAGLVAYLLGHETAHSVRLTNAQRIALMSMMLPVVEYDPTSGPAIRRAWATGKYRFRPAECWADSFAEWAFGLVSPFDRTFYGRDIRDARYPEFGPILFPPMPATDGDVDGVALPIPAPGDDVNLSTIVRGAMALIRDTIDTLEASLDA